MLVLRPHVYLIHNNLRVPFAQLFYCTNFFFLGGVLAADEADRLMDNEYYDSLQFILGHIPKQKRVGLFSATLSSKKLSDIIKFGLRNPVKISVQVSTTRSSYALRQKDH